MSRLSLWRNDTPSFHTWNAFSKDVDGIFSEMDKVLVPFKKGVEKLWSVSADIHETDKDYKLTFDIPGLKKEDIHIELDGNQVSIFGERKEEQKETNAKIHRVECWKGQFRRTFTLPEGVESNQVEANYENGVLQVTIPKVESAPPKRISVK